MIYITIKNERAGLVMPMWLDEGGEVTLSTNDGMVCAKFYTEPEGDEVELSFHPSMLKMLMAWADAQPKYTFMAKEGKAEMIADMEAFDKEWEEKQRKLKGKNLDTPF